MGTPICKDVGYQINQSIHRPRNNKNKRQIVGDRRRQSLTSSQSSVPSHLAGTCICQDLQPGKPNAASQRQGLRSSSNDSKLLAHLRSAPSNRLTTQSQCLSPPYSVALLARAPLPSPVRPRGRSSSSSPSSALLSPSLLAGSPATLMPTTPTTRSPSRSSPPGTLDFVFLGKIGDGWWSCWGGRDMREMLKAGGG